MWECAPSPTVTVLIGPNAAGKTNVLEAIQLTATGRSFRNAGVDQLLRWGADRGSVSLEVRRDDRDLSIGLEFNSDGSRTYTVNGIRRRGLAQIAGIAPIVSFVPADLELVKGAGEHRRSAIDALGEQLSRTYRGLRQSYNRVLRHRNTLLREWEPTDVELEPWTEQLISLGSRLLTHRRRLAQRLAQEMRAIHAAIAEGEDLTIEYHDRCGVGITDLGVEISASEAAEALRRAYTARARDERIRKVTLVGPHRDDLVLLLGGREARSYGSQGQQRSLALAWKLAEVATIEQIAETRPALLLDDVMSELDAMRRRCLIEVIERGVQTIITSTTSAYFDEDALARAVVVRVGED